MRCAECGYKITDKPVRKKGQVFCSVECAEAAEVDVEDIDLDEDEEIVEAKYRRSKLDDDEFSGDDDEDRYEDDRYAYDDDDR